MRRVCMPLLAAAWLAGAELPAPAATAGSATAAALGAALVAGDLVQVEVYGHPDLSGAVRVPAQGAPRFPLVGEVPGVRGMTAEALALELKRRLEADYLRQATVVVTVREHARRMVYVLGSVARPCAVEMLPFDRLTALKAISACGGFLDEADQRSLAVLREDPESGRTERIPVAADPAGGGDVALLPSDLVVVPRLDRVYVLGQVNRPGGIGLPGKEPLTLSKALTLAGGLDRYARESAVQILRPGAAARTVDVEALLDGARGAEDPVLQPGDTVYVPTRRF